MDETRNPWTVLSKSTPYENNWIRVDHHEVLNPAGGPGTYGKVHFKVHAIGVVAVDSKWNVVLVGQYRFATDSYSWEIPEGGGPAGVPIIESIQRELREETGMVAACWAEILVSDLSNSVTDERGTAFLAWNLTETAKQPEDTEQLQVAWVPFWEAIERVKCGQIRDHLSIAALLRVALMALQGELPPELTNAIGSPPPADSGKMSAG